MSSHQQKRKIDPGRFFTPHGESAPDLAPKEQDSYKRSYSERTNMRLRDTDPLIQRSGTSQPVSNSTVEELVDRLIQVSGRPEQIHAELDEARISLPFLRDGGRGLTTILSCLARRRNLKVAMEIWYWMDKSNIPKCVYHYNSLISVCEKCKDWRMALDILRWMDNANPPVQKNEITYSAAISACEKSGNYQIALDLLDQMEKTCEGKSVIPYNAAISACEKGLNSMTALRIFDRMKSRNIAPTVVTYSALISACEKCGQWKLALDTLREMKRAGFGCNVIAYSAAIAALAKGQEWQLALQLFRELQESGETPSVVTYNTTMTALERGLQWEKALDLFDEMKRNHLPVTVVSYGSALSACEKGYQYIQCLDYLDEMTERGIPKNVIIFGAAMSCMEKCRKADIAFQLMDRMKLEGVQPNTHIYNMAITLCARCNMPEKGYELFLAMDQAGLKRDVVTYNACLDAVCTNIPLARSIFHEGVKIGFYSKVSRLGDNWLELDLHFMSLGGGEIALWWWFQECLVEYMVNSDKLSQVKSINIVTGTGKSRQRSQVEVITVNDNMRKRVLAMMSFMNLEEVPQRNPGRVQVNRDQFVEEVRKNGGKIVFDADGYSEFIQKETQRNIIPVKEQIVRPRIPFNPDLIQANTYEERRNQTRDRERADFTGTSNHYSAPPNKKSAELSYYGPSSMVSTNNHLNEETNSRGRGRGRGGRGRGRGFGSNRHQPYQRNNHTDASYQRYERPNQRKPDHLQENSYYGPQQATSSSAHFSNTYNQTRGYKMD